MGAAFAVVGARASLVASLIGTEKRKEVGHVSLLSCPAQPSNLAAPVDAAACSSPAPPMELLDPDKASKLSPVASRTS